jgi:hypothetical protein
LLVAVSLGVFDGCGHANKARTNELTKKMELLCLKSNLKKYCLLLFNLNYF